MLKRLINRSVTAVFISLTFWSCKTPGTAIKTENKFVPMSFNNSQDTINTAKINWKEYFTDSNLIALIDTALKNNQELNIALQEIEISRNEIRARKGEYLPFVGIKGGAGVEKEGRYTRHGAVDENIEIKPGTKFPEPLQDYMFGAYASWELDVWKKLRNAKMAAVARYLSSVEGKNFMVTNLITEIANSYYEVMALDKLLDIIQKNIEIQSSALEIIKQQKEASRVTELAVRRFEAQVLNTKNLQYDIQQKIVVTENKINFLVGRFPQPVKRNSAIFTDLMPDTIYAGVPSQLLQNRTDIRQAELEIVAAKLDVKVAKANFYPSFRITAGVGNQAFNPAYLIKTPESMLYSLAGDLVAPLINRNAIKAAYKSANARQIQAIYNYERTILNAYIEIVNQLSKINNFEQSYTMKSEEVKLLTQSITISNNLFKSARADYMEVLLTQRDALESKMELIETKLQLMNAKINIYKALGGGWN